MVLGDRGVRGLPAQLYVGVIITESGFGLDNATILRRTLAGISVLIEVRQRRKNHAIATSVQVNFMVEFPVLIIYVLFFQVNGGWSPWESWTFCTKTCRRERDTPGTQYRNRSCNNPAPQFEGGDCGGNAHARRPCFDTPCPG